MPNKNWAKKKKMWVDTPQKKTLKITNKPTKRHSTSLVIKEVQIKIKIERYQCTFNKTANTKKTGDFSGSPVVKTLSFHWQGMGGGGGAGGAGQVQFLVWELRCHMPVQHGQNQINKSGAELGAGKTNITHHQYGCGATQDSYTLLMEM